MRQISDFFQDATKTFFYMAFTPLQWMFWHTPKLYEAVISTYIFWKNSIPTKEEIDYTLKFWSINTLILTSSLLLYLLRWKMGMLKYIHNLVKIKYKFFEKK